MSLISLNGIKRARGYTTGDIAKMLHVAPQTVSKWFESGKLQGHKLPGSNDRRIHHESLARFVREHHFPMPRALRNESVLLASDDQRLAQALTDELGESLHIAETAFLAGRRYESIQTAVLIADTRLGAAAIRDLIRDMKDESVACIVIVSEDVPSPPADECEVYRRPFDVALLVERVKSLLADAHV